MANSNFDSIFLQFLIEDVVRYSLELGYHSNSVSLAPNKIFLGYESSFLLEKCE